MPENTLVTVTEVGCLPGKEDRSGFSSPWDITVEWIRTTVPCNFETCSVGKLCSLCCTWASWCSLSSVWAAYLKTPVTCLLMESLYRPCEKRTAMVVLCINVPSVVIHTYLCIPEFVLSIVWKRNTIIIGLFLFWPTRRLGAIFIQNGSFHLLSHLPSRRFGFENWKKTISWCKISGKPKLGLKSSSR